MHGAQSGVCFDVIGADGHRSFEMFACIFEHALVALDDAQSQGGVEGIGLRLNGLSKQGYRQIATTGTIVQHAQRKTCVEVLTVSGENAAKQRGRLLNLTRFLKAYGVFNVFGVANDSSVTPCDVLPEYKKRGDCRHPFFRACAAIYLKPLPVFQTVAARPICRCGGFVGSRADIKISNFVRRIVDVGIDTPIVLTDTGPQVYDAVGVLR